jgi:hypothetical protein
LKIEVWVITRSSSSSISEENGLIIARVKSPPEKGKANNEVIRLLAQHFGVKPSKIRLVSGISSRRKIFEIDI